MKKTAAEPYRDIDFTHAKRGPVVPPEPGKTKISIRLDNAVLDYFRNIIEEAGGGNYQTLIVTIQPLLLPASKDCSQTSGVARQGHSFLASWPWRYNPESGKRLEPPGRYGRSRRSSARS